MTDDPLGRLISSAQSALADVPTTTDYRAKRVLIQSARVQATCALAFAVGRLVDAITKENP